MTRMYTGFNVLCLVFWKNMRHKTRVQLPIHVYEEHEAAISVAGSIVLLACYKGINIE